MIETLEHASGDLAPITRDHILAEAKSWLGTDYIHRASVKGEGTDCVGFIRGLWRVLVGQEPLKLPVYSSDWRSTKGSDLLILAMRRHFLEIPIGQAKAGDILIFRIKAGAPARHCGILTDTNTMIHAYQSYGVVETHMVPWWERRIAAAFSFPNLEPQHA